MAKYKVVSNDPAVEKVEVNGEELAVGAEVELDEAVALPLVETGTLVLVEEQPPQPPVADPIPPVADPVPPENTGAIQPPAGPATPAGADDHTGGGFVGGHTAPN